MSRAKSVSDLVSYSERFNKPIDSLLRKLVGKGYTQKEAKEIVKRVFNISLRYA